MGLDANLVNINSLCQERKQEALQAVVSQLASYSCLAKTPSVHALCILIGLLCRAEVHRTQRNSYYSNPILNGGINWRPKICTHSLDLQLYCSAAATASLSQSQSASTRLRLCHSSYSGQLYLLHLQSSGSLSPLNSFCEVVCKSVQLLYTTTLHHHLLAPRNARMCILRVCVARWLQLAHEGKASR